MELKKLMKGKAFKDVKNITYPMFMEPKVDEIRVHIVIPAGTRTVKYFSYAGKEFPKHMQEFNGIAFRLLQAWWGVGTALVDVEFDCGLCVNNNFNDSYRFVRSKSIPKDLEDAERSLYLYDIPNLYWFTYRERRALMKRLVDSYPEIGSSGYFRLLPRVEVNSEDEAVVQYNALIAQGYEGAMMKNPGGRYTRGRSADWIKMKPSEEADGVIIKINQCISAEGEPHDRAGSITIQCEDGSVCNAAGLDWALGTDMWRNPEKYLNQWVEFRYMQRDRAGGYRHPKFYRLRDAK